MFDRFYVWLKQCQANAQQRHLKTCQPLQGTRVTLETSGPTVINFSGNDYLGLSRHPALLQAAEQALQRYGTGAGSSPLISGHTVLTQQLEQAVAQWKQTESALVLNSGYQGHMAVLQGLLQAGDVVFADKLNHASLVDGVLLANAHARGNITSLRYRHLDLNDLEARLRAQQAVRKPGSQFWMITDTVFSMDGDLADLPALAALAEGYNAWLLVDEAHASGIYGDQRSSGLAEAQGVCDRVTLHLGTFSKALGSFGAYVAGPDVLIQTLINRARGFIYSTALPPAVLAANLAALAVLQDPVTNPKRQLWANVQSLAPQLEAWVKARHPDACPAYGQSPIFPVMTADALNTTRWSASLIQQGFWVHGIRPPSVPQGSCRLRLSLSALHTQQHIKGVLQALQTLF